MITTTTKHDDSRMVLLYLVARELNECLDLDRILRRVLIATTRVVGATNGSFFVFDEHERIDKSLFVNGSTVLDVKRDAVDRILKKGLAGWVKTNKQHVLIHDVEEDNRWYTDDDDPELLIQKSAVLVPLLSGPKLVGILTITHDKPGYFDTSDLTILTAIAEQATTAILNARIYEAEQRRRRLSNALAEISWRMNSVGDTDELFNLILDQLDTLVGYDQSLIFLLNRGYMTIRAARGLIDIEELWNLPVRPYKNDFALPITTDYMPIWVDDLQTQNSWFKDVTDTKSRSWIGAPLVSNGVLLGVITVARHTPDAYTADDMQTVHTLASQTAVAINNINLLNQLQEAQQRYTSLFDESSDMLLILNEEGYILDANRKACQMFRRPKDAVIGSDLALLGQKLKDIFNQQKETITKGKEITTELVIKDAYGQGTPVEINAKRIHIDNNLAVQWAGRDMTARHELRKMRKDMTNMIVHDLRGPTGTLLGSIEMMSFLLESGPSSESNDDALNLLDIALRTGKTLRDLIDSMLDLSKLEQGKFPISLRPVNLQSLLAEVEDQVTPQAQAKSIALTFDTEDSGVFINVDGSMIRRVLVNLIDNAVKYTQSSGKVEVKLLLTEPIVTFQIIDNGAGISEENQQRIFGKFARVDHTSDIRGVGLGLAFCKLAVEAHKGRIWLESELGEGSQFTVEIPRNLGQSPG